MKHSYSVTVRISKIRDPSINHTQTLIVWANALPAITKALLANLRLFPTTREAANPRPKKEPATCPLTKSH